MPLETLQKKQELSKISLLCFYGDVPTVARYSHRSLRLEVERMPNFSRYLVTVRREMLYPFS